MKSQRILLLSYYIVALAIFYRTFINKFMNESYKFDRHRLDRLLSSSFNAIENDCILYYQADDNQTTLNIARGIQNLLKKDNIDSVVKDLYSAQNDQDSVFTVVLQYFDGGDHFSVEVGDDRLLFNISTSLQYTSDLLLIFYNILYNIYHNTSELNYDTLKPSLDVNLVFLSDDEGLDPGIRDMFIKVYMSEIVLSLSKFHEVNFHSRTFSGIDFVENCKVTEEGDGYVLNLQEQTAKFYNFLESLAHVDVSLKGTHIYIHNFTFFILFPSKRTLVYDEITRSKRNSFMIENLGILSILDPVDWDNSDKFQLIFSNWITYLRKLYLLPSTLPEYILFLLDEGEIVKDNGHDFDILLKGFNFNISFKNRGSLFYSFEVKKMTRVLYEIYYKNTLDNLSTLMNKLAKISFNLQIPESTVSYTNNSMNLLEDATVELDMRLRLKNVISAFKESLEALGDDEMYVKDVLSKEHTFAFVMCDMFPFIFPTFINAIKILLNR